MIFGVLVVLLRLLFFVVKHLDTGSGDEIAHTPFGPVKDPASYELRTEGWRDYDWE